MPEAIEYVSEEVRLRPAWREALKRFLAEGYGPGDIIPHSWFYDAFGLPMPTDEMPKARADAIELKKLQQFQTLRIQLLREHKVDLASEPGCGYSVVPPGEQAQLAYKDCVDEMRKIARKSVFRAANVNQSLLTDSQKAEQATATAKLSMLLSMANQPRQLRAPG